MKHDESEIKGLVRSIGLACSDDQASLSHAYLRALLGQNKRVNLISSSDEERVVERHFLDSLQPLVHLKIPENASVMDLGSGAGFPGVPIKILRPDLHMTMVESKAKKCAFLQRVAQELGLSNYQVINTTLTRQSPASEEFDYCLSRAVGNLRDFVKVCGGQLKSGGTLCTFKSDKGLPEERRRLESSRFNRQFVIYKEPRYVLPGIPGKFLLICVKKADPLE